MNTPHLPVAIPAQPLPHLTADELATRWRLSRFTISKKHAAWGLRPIHIGKRKLFPIDQVEEVERRSMTSGK